LSDVIDNAIEVVQSYLDIDREIGWDRYLDWDWDWDLGWDSGWDEDWVYRSRD
jgi:hypothetical protein